MENFNKATRFQPQRNSNAGTETHILIVDDSVFDCQNIERQCRRTNLQLSIDTAKDVKTMQKSMDTKTYDVIFVDYHLANETGLEAQNVIRRHPSHANATTIMMTGEVCHEIAVTAIKSGCQDYVAKYDMDAFSIEMMMKTAAKRLEQHATRVFQKEMDAIHDRTMSAVTEVVRTELSDDRIVSLLMRALGQVSYSGGQSIEHETGENSILNMLDDPNPSFFIFK
ncbi:response regulator [Pacificibacter sp. AS14]|uniref:response regulator n=1 Tax=Pacificibacter sp. AS14 TaxID=3135785 RepID=UPI00317331E3